MDHPINPGLVHIYLFFPFKDKSIGSGGNLSTFYSFSHLHCIHDLPYWLQNKHFLDFISSLLKTNYRKYHGFVRNIHAAYKLGLPLLHQNKPTYGTAPGSECKIRSRCVNYTSYFKIIFFPSILCIFVNATNINLTITSPQLGYQPHLVLDWDENITAIYRIQICNMEDLGRFPTTEA